MTQKLHWKNPSAYSKHLNFFITHIKKYVYEILKKNWAQISKYWNHVLPKRIPTELALYQIKPIKLI